MIRAEGGRSSLFGRSACGKHAQFAGETLSTTYRGESDWLIKGRGITCMNLVWSNMISSIFETWEWREEKALSDCEHAIPRESTRVRVYVYSTPNPPLERSEGAKTRYIYFITPVSQNKNIRKADLKTPLEDAKRSLEENMTVYYCSHCPFH